MKSLLGILILDRPKTVDLCLTHLLRMDQRDQFNILLVDNGSNDTTKEVIRKYEKDVELVITNDWNVGYSFGVNQWMSKRESGQHCIEVDSDLVIKSPDWWEMAYPILTDMDMGMGMVAARRPSAWIDREDKRQGYKDLYFEKRHGHWLEIPNHNFLISPLTIYNGDLLDRIGFHNEATGYGDMEIAYRVKALGYKSAYIPDIFLYHLDNDFETYDHPQRGAHTELLKKNAALNQAYITRYRRGEKLYCGTRWLPETMIDKEYELQSNINWEFHKTWRKHEV